MGFASTIGQVFFVIIFMMAFAQLYLVQHRQNALQTELYAYQKNQLDKQSSTALQLVQVNYNSTWKTTNLQIRNTGSTSIQINNSDLYIDGTKFARSYTSRKFFACYDYTSYRCGELRFGDNANNEEASMLLLYHFNNDSQWSTGNGLLVEEFRNAAANELSRNSAVFNSSGKFDRALYFDGITSYLNRTNTAQTAFTNTTSYTWSFWIYPTAYGNPTSTIVSKNTAAIGYRIYLNSTGNIRLQSINGNFQFNSTVGIPLNQWSHVAIVYTGTAAGTVAFYVNGTLRNSVVHNSIFRTDSASAFNIGRNVSTTNDYFTGLIDEYAYYNAAKTAADVLALYRKGVYSGGLNNFDPDEILEIDAYINLTSGSHTVSYATQEGASVTGTIIV